MYSIVCLEHYPPKAPFAAKLDSVPSGSAIFVAVEYMATVEKWKNELHSNVQFQINWVTKKLDDSALSQTEKDYWRGYLQALKAVAVGEIATEIERSLTVESKEGTPK
jgi:hypothetical protein